MATEHPDSHLHIPRPLASNSTLPGTHPLAPQEATVLRCQTARVQIPLRPRSGSAALPQPRNLWALNLHFRKMGMPTPATSWLLKDQVEGGTSKVLETQIVLRVRGRLTSALSHSKPIYLQGTQL